ncbi:3-hydroxybutyryl-CoA dehydrogenase [Desulfonema ishimotonii]|uniref:3-hydroxybutyryl-CoA dehydrogenase n=1 Tax=Desulfonema ishimotonii TaxID=45657 RepID=A0A401FQP0_9BACT|nr:3-hydroxyacyl-CoA dehydrogenase [Desulfonema ishimotonii]GBC59205.1 3-hydroxybutyryl-CoA dehydrogenase [Desulfonema ishimotonii]
MNIKDIRKILIIGAGTMGHQIGFLCATHGCDVAVYDIDPEILKKAEERTKALSERFISKGRLSPEAAAQTLARISFTDDPEAAGRNADLVSESVPEDPALKGRIFAQFNGICPERTIFTTNTSSLVPSMFADATGRPERFLAFHFHDVALNNVVDVMPHPGTSPEAAETVRAFAEKIGQLPIVLKKEQPGYVFNTMLMTLLDAALNLATKEVASVEDIDRAWMGIMHTASGPFGIMDSVGLDTVWKITAYWAEKRNDPRAKKNAEFIKTYLDKGRLGKKSGQGFYAYPDPAFAAREFLAGKGSA